MPILKYIMHISVKYIYTDEGISGQQQDSSYKLPVVVQGVKVGGGHMIDPRAGVGVGDGRIDRHQVHIVHGDVVTVLATLQEANIDQGCSVKPTVKRCQSTQIKFIHCQLTQIDNLHKSHSSFVNLCKSNSSIVNLQKSHSSIVNLKKKSHSSIVNLQKSHSSIVKLHKSHLSMVNLYIS